MRIVAWAALASLLLGGCVTPAASERDGQEWAKGKTRAPKRHPCTFYEDCKAPCPEKDREKCCRFWKECRDRPAKIPVARADP